MTPFEFQHDWFPDPNESRPNRLPPSVRYKRDPEFTALVDTIHCFIHDARFTPTELREAVILAATMHEATTIRPVFIPRRLPDTDDQNKSG